MPIWPKPSRWSTTSAIPPSATPEKKRSTNRHAALTACASTTTCTPCASLTWFEERYAAFRGLNLTLAVREGIVKHSRDYDAAKHPELAEYFLDQRPPLEAQFIDLADEIAYITADLDDGYEAHLLSLEEIREGVAVFDRFYREVEQVYPDAPDKLKFNEALKRVLNRYVDDLITTTRARANQPGIRTLDDVRSRPERLAAFSPEVDAERRANKAFLYENLYFSPALADEKDDAERVVSELFAFWMENPSALPHNYQEKAKAKAKIKGESLPRVICDYIAGMTDHFIFEQYEKFCALSVSRVIRNAGCPDFSRPLREVGILTLSIPALQSAVSGGTLARVEPRVWSGEVAMPEEQIAELLLERASRCSAREAEQKVPDSPGFYAIFVDEADASRPPLAGILHDRQTELILRRDREEIPAHKARRPRPASSPVIHIL